MENNITKVCPRVSCCGPISWNIQYNSLLKMRYTNHTKRAAFADDMVIMIKAASIGEAENIANVELRKISARVKENKSDSMNKNQK